MDRVTAGYVFAGLIIAAALVGGYFGFLSENAIVGLILLALVVAGLGKMRDGNFEVTLHRLFRAARAWQPTIAVDHVRKTVNLYLLDMEIPKSVERLINRISQKFGYSVRIYRHSGWRLVSDAGWQKIAENPALHGPEFSGATETILVKGGPKFIRVVVRHVKYLAARYFVGFGPAEGGIDMSYDDVIREGEVKECYFVVPVSSGPHNNYPAERDRDIEDYVVVVSSIAFRDTPAVLAYEVYEMPVELPSEGLAIAYISRRKGIVWARPDKVYITKVGRYKVKNWSNYPVEVYVQYIWKLGFLTRLIRFFARLVGYRRAKPLAVATLAPGAEVEFTVDQYDLRWPVSVSVSPTVDGSMGYVILTKVEEKPPETGGGGGGEGNAEQIEIMSGDEIRPDAEPWVGSAGVAYKGYLLTNAHVCPKEGQVVYVNKGGWRRIGKVSKVADIKTVTGLDILLNWLLGIKLPTNKVDAAMIVTDDNVKYAKFRSYPDTIGDAEVGEEVYSRGRTSGSRKGVVREKSVTVMVPWPHKNNQPAIFEDVIMLEMETRPGDSGSAVVNEKGWIGLIFAGDASYSIGLAIKASNIAKWLG